MTWGRVKLPQLQNLATYSQDFSVASAWQAVGTTLTQNTTDTLAPDGTQTAARLVETTANTQHDVRRWYLNGLPFVSNRMYTMSVYVKKMSTYRRYVYLVRGTNPVTTFYEWDTGLLTNVGTSVGFTMGRQILSDGWVRIYMSIAGITVNSTIIYVGASDTNVANNPTYVGNTSYGMYVWGYQHESGPELHDYVKTGATTFGANKRFQID